jgi:hypothetical protein
LIRVRDVIREGPSAPGCVPLGGLHLDDLGARIGQQPGAIGPRDEITELQDLKTFEERVPCF